MSEFNQAKQKMNLSDQAIDNLEVAIKKTLKTMKLLESEKNVHKAQLLHLSANSFDSLKDLLN